MTDERRPPPRRFLRPAPPDEPEVTRVDEDPVLPITERVPMIPPPAKVPTEPFMLLKGRQPSYVEFAAQLTGFSAQLATVTSTQNKMALQLDHHGQIINQRFDVFHGELALLRHDQEELLKLVSSNHGPRLSKVEQTIGQKAAKGGGLAALAIVALPILADALPKYRHLFDAIAGVFQ